MNLETAIKEMEKEIPPIPANEWSYNTQAKALGIEALKEFAALRSVLKALGKSLLPGETED